MILFQSTLDHHHEKDHHMSYPIHFRYQSPAKDDSKYTRLSIPPPHVWFQCQSSSEDEAFWHRSVERNRGGATSLPLTYDFLIEVHSQESFHSTTLVCPFQLECKTIEGLSRCSRLVLPCLDQSVSFSLASGINILPRLWPKRLYNIS